MTDRTWVLRATGPTQKIAPKSNHFLEVPNEGISKYLVYADVEDWSLNRELMGGLMRVDGSEASRGGIQCG